MKFRLSGHMCRHQLRHLLSCEQDGRAFRSLASAAKHLYFQADIEDLRAATLPAAPKTRLAQELRLKERETAKFSCHTACSMRQTGWLNARHLLP